MSYYTVGTIMKKMNVSELNSLYRDAESCDKQKYSEMRSNVLLIAGEHYTKSASKQFARLRETNNLTEAQRLRLTKNHIYRIHKTYVNSILDKAPGVQMTPKNEMEMQDRKAAELHEAVWTDQVERNKLHDKIAQYADSFCGTGEVAVKVFWDPTKGALESYAPLVDEETGEPYVDPETGQMVADESKPQFTGDVCYEPIHGFNLFRDPAANSMDDSAYIGIRKMTKKDHLEKMYQADPEKLKMLEVGSEKEFVVFDSNKATYKKAEEQVLIKEVYYRPCLVYPRGYFYIWTSSGILEEGELPDALFPIVWEGFNKHATTPRATSIVKIARPYQAEINRAASQAATHQVTLGDDKVLYQSGSKLTQGALLPGVRGISYNGQQPTILPGRTGEQYLNYMAQQIDEMYKAVFLDVISQKETGQSTDPYGQLYKSMSQQAVFKPYVDSFSRFLVSLAELALRTCKNNMSENMFIQAAGRNEAVNIAEFKQQSDFSFQVVVKPMGDSIDTMMGKQLTMQHMLQYVGKSMKPDDIGKIMKNMPFMNNEEAFSDLTLEYDNVTNDMLALERGEQVSMSPYADNQYYIKKLTHRVKQADFKLLNPQIQQMYQMLIRQHQDEEVRKQQEILKAKNEYIPTDGPLITVDLYVSDPKNPEAPAKRAKVPQRAMEHLLKILEMQGASLDKLEEMNQGNLAEIAQQLTGQPQPQLPPGMVG